MFYYLILISIPYRVEVIDGVTRTRYCVVVLAFYFLVLVKLGILKLFPCVVVGIINNNSIQCHQSHY